MVKHAASEEEDRLDQFFHGERNTGARREKLWRNCDASLFLILTGVNTF
jgi:hypothetical protein